MADKKDNIVLSIRDMSKSFGRNRVLTRINLDVKAGKRRWKINDDEVSFRYLSKRRRKYLPGWERGKFFRTEGGVGKRYRYGSPGIESVSGEKCS